MIDRRSIEASRAGWPCKPWGLHWRPTFPMCTVMLHVVFPIMHPDHAEKTTTYTRWQHEERSTSLSVLTTLVPRGVDVLDVGLGGGELGERLVRDRGCCVDGVTLSAEEAAQAAAHYRQIEIADLEDVSLVSLFGGRRYGAIVCADVLEHLTRPAAVLDACRELLSEDGVLLLSIPNVAYVGLIGELLGGEFRYRDVGLLDRTHVRFFTRSSLLRMLHDHAWHVDLVDRIKVDLPDSEFRVAFQQLPPAVQRHLLAVPDGLTYQFLVRARPMAAQPAVANEAAAGAGEELPREDIPHFSALLYLKEQDGYAESRKVAARGRIGERRQCIRFDLRARERASTGLRLDPADRPGFLHLHGMRLFGAAGELVWTWDGGSESLMRGDHHQVLFRPLQSGQPGLIAALTGEDPYFELPVTPEQLALCRRGGVLEVDLDWPMSADYTAFLDELSQRQARLEALERELAQQRAIADRLRGEAAALQSERSAVQPVAPGAATGTEPLAPGVDVIVPVYRGVAETRACIESVLASAPRTPFRLLLINDASPEPEVTAYLRAVRERDSRVDLIENASNVGFVASANDGMQRGGRRDVVLLNSDTEVAGDWLDRLRRAAYRDSRIGTATPFSNSATICSYPRFCEDNALPRGLTTAGLDRLFARENDGVVIDVPTAVGFCMYIRRDCLDAVGAFDVERFGRGYGEENDFCMRARSAGWRHVLAADTFVAHAGGVSFGAEKPRRVQEAQDALQQLHPHYPELVRQHLAADPARMARLKVDFARVRASGLRSVLFVAHRDGGGTERHWRELAALLDGKAHVFLLRPADSGETRLEALGAGEGLRLGFRLDDQSGALLDTLRALQVSHVHFHHLLGHAASVRDLPSALGVTHDFTVHDFYSVCPQISLTDDRLRYCGERGVAQCTACLAQRPAPNGESIEAWRAAFRPLIERARYVFAPSVETARRLQRYFPTARFVAVPHPDFDAHRPVATPGRVAPQRPLRIVVVGALSGIKGADVLEATARAAAQRGFALEFHLLGYAYRPLAGEPDAPLTVHGRYEEPDLPRQLAALAPDLAWFPAQWPETYSYTLSACLNAQLPIAAADFGAFPERLHDRAWTWLCPWDRTAPEWADFFERLRREHFVPNVGPARAQGRPAAAPAFDYVRDYLGDLVTGAELPPSSSYPARTQGADGNPTAEGATNRSALLTLAMRLRAAPVIGELARRLPPQWKARARTWLRS